MRFDKAVAPELDPPEAIKNNPGAVRFWRACVRRGIKVEVVEMSSKDIKTLLEAIGSEEEWTAGAYEALPEPEIPRDYETE